MFWLTILVDTPNGNLLFGYLSETSTVLIFGVFLIVATVGLRWLLNKQDETVDKTKKFGKR